MRVELQPLARTPEAIYSYLDINFRRLQDALSMLSNMEYEVAAVTGSLEIDTGLPEIYAVQATLKDAPTSTGCFVTAELSATPGNIILKVYKSDFTLSVVAKNVNWMVVGE